ncbi:bifunctional 23S rRNA (guanine(2069)-N(7))-methyltransferase RlmK/23S rRNA (guanine(2445)-N(2))-methyltransferase RlmL [Marinomonas mediterranea]|uniref:bifunctional 23S rRNA (guanine(2069)-N(7))-methyltransferase RlmK/23S rRNA (guanine(2445)-N(2))-methyltransferase RlmL n=1 Tax=Marinomonas mediterranea TaxID=119864 RepID=UPI00234B428B|nr:bifunctional 23S rRNA (guanine(2069)-N(7))-methyltransferase RlmK/23S rRNA (guanine(2445)-N(2))-methyltransferase RlmL [Marinomonas mediterranea]WCN09749.1 bifunctional 23S rRNA (guanine(2069)-N(7))-methyltransferase RlmK/23S rRNA (guanine(2445)-N(2))-methyltransferase RlmL [Marinomonas mediterranea]WCN13831.1 bifunctional 23S rRNA (guanine(2069)-N(7))-methyltransferase RlmK/23S rRNA (guanine(2445)-N(2))-methyltransferase RlmL [Marinomonas mediterranea]
MTENMNDQLDASATFSIELTCPIGLENVLENELHELGLTNTRLGEAQVKLTCDLRGIYLACLWSRVATRVMLPLTHFNMDSADDLYQGVKSIEWSDHLSVHSTIAIDCHGTNKEIRNTQFGALKTKDAIADYFVEKSGQRPNVEKQQPDVRIAVRVKREKVTVSLDLSGDSLHKRGYRQQGGMAPLKENLAAGMLLRAGWSKNSQFSQLVDPMCGSGTFLVEAALISLNIAPGLRRQYWGFKGWKQHDHRLWQQLQDFAKNERVSVDDLTVTFQGTDREQKAIAAARENIKRAGLTGIVEVSLSAFQEHDFSWQGSTPLVIVNPPYGERLGDEMALISLYSQLGYWVTENALGGVCALLTSNDQLARQVPIRPEKHTRILNGGLECRFYLFPVVEGSIKRGDRQQAVMSQGAQMFANRLQKNVKKFKKWLAADKVSCYRVYDADMPEYAVAIDMYDDWAHVQEYQAPKSVDEEKARVRLMEIVTAIPSALNIPETNVVVKHRQRQSGKQQYEKVATSQHEMIVQEHGCDFIVNLKDYLDTGLFLDHRPVRKYIQDNANGVRFLNLFCYTASASVHAGQGGARSTLSVDMSNTYVDWARRNIELNEFSDRDHGVVRADCFEWLRKSTNEFDFIFMDPPTFSNSKKMSNVLDIQRDHVELIDLAMARLSDGGQLVFSNNYRRFVLDSELSERYVVKDITAQTLDPDFQRNNRIHQCWVLQKRG